MNPGRIQGGSPELVTLRGLCPMRYPDRSTNPETARLAAFRQVVRLFQVGYYRHTSAETDELQILPVMVLVK